MTPELEKRLVAIADRVVPQYRSGRRAYSCTGTTAKLWQAAYDGALSMATSPGGEKR